MKVQLRLNLRSILITLSLIFTYPRLMAAEPLDSKKILVIYPFAAIGEWGMDFNTGFNPGITSSAAFKASVYLHFLKADISIRDEDRMSELNNLTKAYHFDIVIGLLPPVHDFLINRGSELFADIPILLVATGDKEIDTVKDEDNFYYIKSSAPTAITETIADIKQMMPRLKHLYVHSGSGPSDLPYLEMLKKQVDKYFNSAMVEYWVGNPIGEVFTLASKVEENSAILLLATNTDRYGNAYIMSDFFPHYSEIANAPIFSFYDSEFGVGIVGGTMTSAKSYGEYAAIATNSIFAGDGKQTIGMADTAQKKYDWRQLKRWDFDLLRVPHSAKILFMEESFWRKYKEIVIVVFLIILLQSTTIIFLFNQVKRIKQLHLELEKKHEQISRSLEAKEVLLREIHHRVKNNLSLVISFLSLQSDYLSDKKMLDVLAKLQGRIYAMSLVHELLYEEEGIDRIDIARYLQELCDSIIYSFHDSESEIISYSIDVESQKLSMDALIPLGLIFNELITNSTKYAFKKIEEPKISLKGKRSESGYVFEYSDNGIGLPENIESGSNQSFGFSIVKALVSQIKGTFKIDRLAGDKIIISCPIRT